MVQLFGIKTEKCKFHTYLWAFFFVYLLLLGSCKSSKPSKTELETYRMIGEKIRTERIKRGMTQAELSEAVDLSQNSLSLIEDGLATPIEHKIEAIENYLQLDLLNIDSISQ